MMRIYRHDQSFDELGNELSGSKRPTRIASVTTSLVERESVTARKSVFLATKFALSGIAPTNGYCSNGALVVRTACDVHLKSSE